MNHRGASRREFLRTAARFAAGASLLSGNRLSAQHKEAPVSPDESICREHLKRAIDENQSRLPMGDLVAQTGRAFLGQPYRANTLEVPGKEHLVVNLREFDCVTFCETSLALARAIKLRRTTTDAYAAQLQRIRYRSGRIDGYASRLHYFSDWVADNEEKKIVKDVTARLGGIRSHRALTFMSMHREAYPRLSDEEEFQGILRAEKRLATTPRYYLPKGNLAAVLGGLHQGDIIAITTSTPGLDVSHTGIAVEEGGELKLLHAPSAGERVSISRGTLVEYLARHGTQTGIIVVRPLEPVME